MEDDVRHVVEKYRNDPHGRFDFLNGVKALKRQRPLPVDSCAEDGLNSIERDGYIDRAVAELDKQNEELANLIKWLRT
jgi:hypothetical protein